MKQLKKNIYAITVSTVLFFTGCDNTENAGRVNSGVKGNEIEISINIPGIGITKVGMNDIAIQSIEIKVYQYNTTTLVTTPEISTVTVPFTRSGSTWVGKIDISASGNLLFCARAFNTTDSSGTMLYCGQQLQAVSGTNHAVTIGMKDHYDLRDVGPAGGLIFYIETNTELVISRGWKYLEAAPTNITTDTGYQWKTTNTGTGGTELAIGTGAANTVAMAGAEHPAAEACREYSVPGFPAGSWFLPSRYELKRMCWNLRGLDYDIGSILNPAVSNASTGGVGGFNPDRTYWSSAQSGETDAGCHNFYDGREMSLPKDIYGWVRAVRAFNN